MKFEEVTSVEAPPRGRVESGGHLDDEGRLGEGVQRRVDYLDGFLKAQPPALSSEEPGGDLYEAVLDALKDIFDPEIPVNIYELGLIYGVEIDSGHVTVNMTLTTPNCPVAETMPAEVEIRVGAVPGVGIVDVNLVWDPPWDPSRMTDEARLELGML